MTGPVSSDRPREDSPGILVARFLRSNNYNETLDAFLAEAGLPPDAGVTSPGVLTIEKILDEKHVFDLSRNFEKTKLDDTDKGWSMPAPSVASVVTNCDITSNVLSVGVERMSLPGEQKDTRMIVTAADKRIHCLKSLANPEPGLLSVQANDSPTLCYAVIEEKYLATGTMAGKMCLYDLGTGNLLAERKDHQKYIVRLSCHVASSGTWIATAAWDSRIFLYHVATGLDAHRLGSPCAQVLLDTNPQAVAFVSHPDMDDPILIVSRRDSTFLYYYALPQTTTISREDQPADLVLLGRQNLAPHSNAWIAFTPSSLAISPNDPYLLAVATSHTPHMNVIIVKILLPKLQLDTNGRLSNDPLPLAPENFTQAAQARAEIATQDREDAAILIQCNTLAPQSQYSTPELAWRPDGTGIWVNGDDGVLRGIETTTGKIKSTLKGAHEAGTKIRCLWAGTITAAENIEEWVISGGFDRRLVVWKQGASEQPRLLATHCRRTSPRRQAQIIIMRGSTGLILRTPLWSMPRSRNVRNGRSTTKIGLMVLMCLLLGYPIARLYSERDASQRHVIGHVTENGPTAVVPFDDESPADYGQSSDTATKTNSNKRPGLTDHSLDLPKLQANKHPEPQSLYSQVTSNLGKLSDWTKSRLDKLTGTHVGTTNATVPPPSTSTSSTLSDGNRLAFGGEEISGLSSSIHGEVPTIGKVSIITGDQPSNRLYERALRTHTAHNRLHNYQMFTLRESILDDVWTKPAYILSIILRELAKPTVERLKWLLWVDADTIILNPHIPAELFLPPDTSAGDWDDIHMLVTYDWNGLNNGVFPIRVHSWSVSLLSAILAFRHYRPAADLTFRDQSAMAMLLEEPAFRKHIMHAPQRWYNAYRGEINETIAPFQFRRGDFLVHFAGDSERDEHMRYWLERAEQHADEWEVALKYTTYPGEVKEFWHSAALEKSAHRQARVDAVHHLDSLIARVSEALSTHAAKIEEPVRKHVEGVLERIRNVLADADASTQVIKDARAELEKEATIIMGHAAASLAATVKAAHEAIFDAEHVLFADVFTDQLQTEIQGVEDQLQQLRLKMQHEPLQEDQVVTATNYLIELFTALEVHIEDLQGTLDAAAEDHKTSTSPSHTDPNQTLQTGVGLSVSPVQVDHVTSHSENKSHADTLEGVDGKPVPVNIAHKDSEEIVPTTEERIDEQEEDKNSSPQSDQAAGIKAAEKDAADNWEKVKPGLPSDG